MRLSIANDTHAIPSQPHWRRIRLAAGIALALAVFAYFAALPWLARRVITAKFRDAGITQASFSLSNVSPFGLVMRQVTVGEPKTIRADLIRLSYTPGSLWRGKLKDVDIHGAQVNGRIDGEGLIDLGIPLRDGTTGSNELPLERIDISDSSVTVDWNGRSISLPLTASLTQGPANEMQIEATVAAASMPTSLGEWRMKNLVANASIGADGSSQRVIEVSMTAESIMLDTPTELFGLLGIRASIPFGGKHDVGPTNSFEVDHVEFRGEQFPGPAGSLAVNDRTLDATIKWSPLNGVDLSATVQATLGDDGITGEFKGQIPAFAIEPVLRLADADGRFTEAEIAGTCSVQAKVHLAAGKITPLVTTALRDVMVHHPQWTAQIDSASADISINGFSPLSTPTNQSIVINKGGFGILKLSDARAEFQVIDRNHIALQSAHCSLGEFGSFTASPFDLDITQPVIRTTLTGDAIQLKPWLALLTNDRVRGEGELEGLLAIRIRPTNDFAIELGEGVLQAVPADGFIQIQDHEMVDNLVARMDLGGEETLIQVRDRIVAAVQDFRFTEFAVEFLPQDDEVLCRIETRGFGRTGQKPQEIGGAVVNIHHFDDVLHAVIRGKAIYDQLE